MLISVIVIMIVIAFSLPACGKAIANVAEKAVENTISSNADVHVDETGVGNIQ